ncbi:DNA transposase, partial [Frankliniella fusca]
MKKYDTSQKEKIDTLLASLPPNQHLSVQACINAAKAKSKKGRRYTKQWMFECILMRMKGPALYRKKQQDDILPLPSPRTIQRYLKKMKPAYGFNRVTFELLAQKAESMPADERHGSLLLDEMKLTEGIYYDKDTMMVEGLINMDRHTPECDKNKTGDHSLVIMFQPFKEIWLQSVAALLTRGAAEGKKPLEQYPYITEQGDDEDSPQRT